MEKQILNIGLNSIKDHIKGETLDDFFMIYDNFLESVDYLSELVITDYPVKLNIALAVFCTEGYAKMNIGLNKVLIQEKHFVVIFAGQIIQALEVSSDFKAGFIFLKHDFFNIQNNFMEVMSLQKIFIQQSYYYLTDSELQEVMVIYNQIKKKINETDNVYRVKIIQDYCNIMFYNVCNIFFRDKNQLKETKNRKDEIFELFIKEVENQYRKEHNIKYYAGVLNLTPKYLSSIIYEISGRLAGEWIKEYLLLEAKALLKSSNLTIQQISDELHFSTQSHFGRFFKQHTGVSPREYQKE